jgi:hypothetical protein
MFGKTIGENYAHEIVEIGNVSIVLLNGQVREMLDVLHVLVLRKNFFLVKHVVKFKGKFTIRRRSYIVSKFGQLVATCKLENDLYKLEISNETSKVFTNVTSPSSSASLWHERLGHINQGHL